MYWATTPASGQPEAVGAAAILVLKPSG